MTIDEFNQWLKDKDAEFEQILESEREGFNFRPQSHSFINVNYDQTAWGEKPLFLKEISFTQDLVGLSTQELLETVNKFSEEVEFLKKHRVDVYDHGVTSIVEDEFEYEFRLQCNYKDFVPNAEIPNVKKAWIKHEINKALKPDSESKYRWVDCGALKLFKDGVIDWDALQKITYQDCEI